MQVPSDMNYAMRSGMLRGKMDCARSQLQSAIDVFIEGPEARLVSAEDRLHLTVHVMRQAIALLDEGINS